MSIVKRSAMLQIRVTPAIKKASEVILRRVGLNMTEAVELFLRRVIVDQKLPFDVVAIDAATYARLLADTDDGGASEKKARARTQRTADASSKAHRARTKAKGG